MKTILIIEDNIGVQQYFEDHFEDLYKMIFLDDITKALDILRRDMPEIDLIITCWNFGNGQTAYPFINKIKDNITEQFNEIPFIVFSSDEYCKTKVENLGGTFIKKPEGINTILRKIIQLIGK